MASFSWSQSLSESLIAVRDSLSEISPRALTAVVLIAAGWALAALLRVLVRRVVSWMEHLVRRRTGAGETPGQKMVGKVAASIVFWLVFLFFIAAATEQLGLVVVTQGLAGLASYLPAVLGSVFIVLAALLLTEHLRRGAVSLAAWYGIRNAEVVGELTRALIFVIAGVLALDQLGVDSTILVVLSATFFAGLVGAASLAFGLGARTTVGNILAAHYLPESYRPGQTIRIEGITGRVIEIRRTSVVLDTESGQVVVPAKMFAESVSILVHEEES